MFRFIFFSLFISSFAFAQNIGAGDVSVTPEKADAAIVDVGVPASAPIVTPPSTTVEEIPKLEDIVKEGEKAVGDVKEAVATGSIVSIAAAISSTLFLLIGLLKRYGKLFLSGNAIRVSTVVIGALAALAGYISAGLPVSQMIILFVSGPGAIAINELLKPLLEKSV